MTSRTDERRLNELGPLPDAVDVGRLVSQQEMKPRRRRCRFPVRLGFWGSRMCLWVRSVEEARDWETFYKYFLDSAESEPHFELFLEVEGEVEENFLLSIFRKDGLRKAIVLCRSGFPDQVCSRFERWSSVPSPIPPFRFPPLNRKVWVLNAGSVRTADGRGILFIGPPYQGKSTMVSLVVDRGGTPLSDNISVLNLNRASILPYLTPSGVREETVDRLPSARAAIRRMERPFSTVSEVTGLVHLLHFDELFSNLAAPQETALSDVIFLRNDRGGLGTKFSLRSVPVELALRGLRQHRVTTGLDEESWHHSMASALKEVRMSALNFDLAACNLNEVIDDILA